MYRVVKIDSSMRLKLTKYNIYRTRVQIRIKPYSIRLIQYTKNNFYCNVKNWHFYINFGLPLELSDGYTNLTCQIHRTTAKFLGCKSIEGI
jgi:hypothetical protein